MLLETKESFLKQGMECTFSWFSVYPDQIMMCIKNETFVLVLFPLFLFACWKTEKEKPALNSGFYLILS